jgi:DNA-binding MarR family transcriptional regulator
MATSPTVEPSTDVRSLPGSLTGDTGFWLAKLGWAATKLFVQTLEPCGLRPKHYAVLSMLAEQGPKSQQAVGELLNIDASTMVALVDDLEGEGLAERRRNPADRRAYAVHPTAKGEELRATARRAVKEMDDHLVSPLDEAERAQLHDLLVRVAAAGHLPQAVPPGFSGPSGCGRAG